MRIPHWLLTRHEGGWTAEYVSANGAVIATTRTYTTRASALYGIGSVMGNDVKRTRTGLQVRRGDFAIAVVERDEVRDR